MNYLFRILACARMINYCNSTVAPAAVSLAFATLVKMLRILQAISETFITIAMPLASTQIEVSSDSSAVS